MSKFPWVRSNPVVLILWLISHSQPARLLPPTFFPRRKPSPLVPMSATFLNTETTRGSAKSSQSTTETPIKGLFISDFKITSSSVSSHSSIGNAATPSASSRLRQSQSQERPLPPTKALGKRLFEEEDMVSHFRRCKAMAYFQRMITLH